MSVESTGMGRTSLILVFAGVIAVLLLTACGGGDDPEAATQS
jgi:hypothetical protein